MTHSIDTILSSVEAEINLLWQAHKAVKLEGFMCLYTKPTQDPWRAKEAGLAFWFNEEQTSQAIEIIKTHYNNGELPNSPLLLNPMIHHKKEDGNYEPVGSGFVWSTAFCLGVDTLQDDQQARIEGLGVHTSPFTRAQNKRAGLKMLAFSKKPLTPLPDGTVPGCKELYRVSHIQSEPYYSYYLLSGLSYLSTHGSFVHPEFSSLFGGKDPASLIKSTAIDVQTLADAAQAWDAYDHHHSLYEKFGTDTAKIEHNLRFFNLCARDIGLFDATGPMRKGAEESFDFVVPGLIPRGSVTLIAASGGTGKSSVAHHLCVMAAIDYDAKEERPRWLGQPLNTNICKGICVYFSGEDGPAIINARGALFDPEARAQRLMFQRTDFGEGVTFSQFLKRLHKMPDVPIMVIDPARKYLTGDENDAGVVSEFFEAAEEFAITKNTAVIVVHHLQKGANPRSAREVLDELRGSQVFIDRPRVVLGMYRDGPHTVMGLAKNNIPPNLGMVMEERVFVRNPKDLSLIWLPGKEGVRNAPLSPEELETLEAESARSHAQ